MKSVCNLCKTLLLLSVGLCSIPLSATYAVTQANNAVSSIQPPRLLTATTSYKEAGAREAIYYFTIAVPATAKEPLQQLTFTQTQGLESILFNEKESRAFEGIPKREGEKLALTLSTERQKRTITVTFAQPVPAGKTVTIGLKPFHNPLYDGVYLFQVRAFLSGQQNNGQYLGTGRLQFYQEV